MTEEVKPKKAMKFNCKSPKCDFSGTSPYAVKQHYKQYPSHSPKAKADKVKKVTPRRPRQIAVDSSLIKLSLPQLQAELTARQDKLAAIDAQKQQLIAEIQNCDKQLMGTNGSPKVKAKAPKAKATAGKPGRKAKALTLNRALVKVLKSRKKGMKVSDLAAAVLKVGYQTKSTNLYPMINQALRDQELFVKLERGVYATK